MTDKELQKLSRSELLEMLIAQTEENDRLKHRLDEAEARLKDRQIAIENSGSIAEAALSLNGVFEAADKAAKQYLENIEQLSSRQEELSRDMQAKAEQQAAETISAADDYSKRAHAQADAYWNEVIEKAAALLKDQDALRAAVQSAKTNIDEENES